MNAKEERNIILRVSKYGAEHQIFVYSDMKDALKLDSTDDTFLHNNCMKFPYQQEPNSNHLLVQINASNNGFIGSEFRLLPTALYNYVDYIEIKQARRSSTIAFILSLVAILISFAQLIYQLNNPVN